MLSGCYVKVGLSRRTNEGLGGANYGFIRTRARDYGSLGDNCKGQGPDSSLHAWGADCASFMYIGDEPAG